MSAAIEKAKRVQAEAALCIARRALEKIATGYHNNKSNNIAADALDEMFRAGPKQPLHGLVGHERRDR